jgi:hypothetical protein
MSFKNWFILDKNKNGINFNIRPALGQLKKNVATNAIKLSSLERFFDTLINST